MAEFGGCPISSNSHTHLSVDCLWLFCRGRAGLSSCKMRVIWTTETNTVPVWSSTEKCYWFLVSSIRTEIGLVLLLSGGRDKGEKNQSLDSERSEKQAVFTKILIKKYRKGPEPQRQRKDLTCWEWERSEQERKISSYFFKSKRNILTIEHVHICNQ